ncbi:hypothetical protein [Nitratidesulfovibrio vulgaris]|uniref:Nickel transport protein n=1 Tax=Nitratidesulfovibrio vulgaris (strain DP4) TaxID=391774 RepID=A0A0H3A8K4_NITV4|nr:hypothetical protein [Nitratidesulfovibrio vulgaris]ABM28938.1 conserved hypothetical protein [Nitratidesulfovibrio vulgaris DP4]GEB78887.1 hypothetical protein DDE01_03020 [Desulfovibrio desulfuricans]
MIIHSAISTGLSRLSASVLTFVLAITLATPALAHRVNIFAWAEGGNIIAEATFNSGNPARNSKVTAIDAADGTVLGEATTNEQGKATLPITDAMRQRKATLRLELQASEGHRNTWELTPEDYLSAEAPGAQPIAPVVAAASPTAPQATQSQTAVPATSRNIDEATMRRIIDEALEAKLAPLRHSIAASTAGGPRLPEIFGGIGYLVGMAGLALWARSRRR